jgi:hypothetical protein
MGQPLGRYEQVLPEIPTLLDIEIDCCNPLRVILLVLAKQTVHCSILTIAGVIKLEAALISLLAMIYEQSYWQDPLTRRFAGWFVVRIQKTKYGIESSEWRIEMGGNQVGNAWQEVNG